ncbi:M16 family metallopeptidase [Alkaliphilus hydrothermalis]|uniref:Zn-dependent peptidase n=1 Tax=Alkaliphilus hydrothermalis TaxID=1482730 RepID=A0ABS2NLB9_9FIRM|nr:pitrilysin family protein [Alkaliphilus hydrothermalis]MBM7613720.1 putative Zn-dependent peptidase [Alkaliphilus hydrothermalis]
MYKKYTLDNGLRIVTEHIPYVKSISIGVWIEAGSKHENLINNGASHFIEHMLFKGTATRSAKDLADVVDGVGGQINAFTAKECTCYYLKVLDSHYKLAIDILADMIFNSKFDEKDIDRERSVILEELSMYEDSPEDVAHDLLSQSILKDHSLGYPILGTRETLLATTRESLLAHMEKYYIPKNAVISVAGNFEPESLLKEIKEKFGSWKSTETNTYEGKEPNYHFEIVEKVKDIEQTHLCIGFKGIEMGNRELYPLLVVNNILGGSMSSRLFQQIREERGLAYSVYSYPSIYKDGGLLTIYAGMNPSQLEEVCLLIKQEVDTLVGKGITHAELDKAKEQLKGSYILGLESTSSRMTSIGKSELLLAKTYSPKEIIQMIDEIKMDEINGIIKKIFATDSMTVTVVSKQEQKNQVKKALLRK